MKVPDGVKEKEISASCKYGVLKVVLPKSFKEEKKKDQKIPVEQKGR